MLRVEAGFKVERVGDFVRIADQAIKVSDIAEVRVVPCGNDFQVRVEGHKARVYALWAATTTSPYGLRRRILAAAKGPAS